MIYCWMEKRERDSFRFDSFCPVNCRQNEKVRRGGDGFRAFNRWIGSPEKHYYEKSTSIPNIVMIDLKNK